MRDIILNSDGIKLPDTLTDNGPVVINGWSVNDKESNLTYISYNGNWLLCGIIWNCWLRKWLQNIIPDVFWS